MSLHHTQDALCPLCEEKLKDAHPLLVEVYHSFIKPKFPDAHISWTYRGEEDQNRFFEEGKTRCRFPNSSHNVKPSRAMDLFQIRPDKVAAWPKEWFSRIADALEQAGQPIEWGGHWKSIGDGDHFEIKKGAE